MKYLRKIRIECDAERVDGTEEQAARLGIQLRPDGSFQAQGSIGWQAGRVGDWLLRWPDDRIQVFTDFSFRMMYEPAQTPNITL